MKKLCATCGTEYSKNFDEELCPICNEERQYVPLTGQAWTTHEELSTTHRTQIIKLKDNLYEIVIAPKFAIGQRALLVVTEQGNILWDCIPLLDENAINFITSKGGLRAMAISHPHYYSNMNQWAEVFDCPVYIHYKDEQWIFNRGKKITLWKGVEKEIVQGIKLINIGGHFSGSSILHVPFLSNKGAIFCGDSFYVSLSKKHASVMYSYPNRIPLPLAEITRIKKQVMNIEFDTLYGFYDYQNIYGSAKELIKTSLEKYL